MLNLQEGLILLRESGEHIGIVTTLSAELFQTERERRAEGGTDITVLFLFAILSRMGLGGMHILKSYHILRVCKCYDFP